jgi:hypothetical protein
MVGIHREDGRIETVHEFESNILRTTTDLDIDFIDLHQNTTYLAREKEFEFFASQYETSAKVRSKPRFHSGSITLEAVMFASHIALGVPTEQNGARLIEIKPTGRARERQTLQA